MGNPLFGGSGGNDLAQEAADAESCGAYHLRDQRGGGHAGNGVDFEEEKLIPVQNEIYAYHAGAVQAGVNLAGGLLDEFAFRLADARRADFLTLAVVLGVIVEKLILRNDLDYGYVRG